MSLSVGGVGVRGEVCGPALEVEGRGVSISSTYVSVASSAPGCSGNVSSKTSGPSTNAWPKSISLSTSDVNKTSSSSWQCVKSLLSCKKLPHVFCSAESDVYVTRGSCVCYTR